MDNLRLLSNHPFVTAHSAPDDRDDFVFLDCNTPSDAELSSPPQNIGNKVLQAVTASPVFKNLRSEDAVNIRITERSSSDSRVLADFSVAHSGESMLGNLRKILQALITNQVLNRINFNPFDVSVTAITAIKSQFGPKRITHVIPDTANIPTKYMSSVEKIINQPWARLQTVELAHFIEFLKKNHPGRFDICDSGYGKSPLIVKGRKPSKLVKRRLEQYAKSLEPKKDFYSSPLGIPDISSALPSISII